MRDRLCRTPARLKSHSKDSDDAVGGTHPQNGLPDQYARLADSATGPSPGGRLINREPFNSLGHLDSPRGLVRFRLSHGGTGPRL